MPVLSEASRPPSNSTSRSNANSPATSASSGMRALMLRARRTASWRRSSPEGPSSRRCTSGTARPAPVGAARAVPPHSGLDTGCALLGSCVLPGPVAWPSSLRRPGRRGPPPRVVRPPSSRRVRATCASGESDGWQQVKIRRSRSSCTDPVSSPGRSSTSATTWEASSRPRDSRRRCSIARLRAVVVIQPPGLGGNPSAGHFRRARANASWTASSARSMSPKILIRVATDRPASSRNIRPISASSTSGNVQPPTVSTNGHTSIGDEISLVTFAAQPSASSRSAASMM